MKSARVAGTWTLAVAALVGMTVSGNPIGFATNSLFLGPMTQSFGWSRVDFFTALSVSSLCGAAFAPVVGRLVDRFGVRRCLLPGILVYAATIASYSLLNGSLALYMLLALTQSMAAMVQGPLCYSKAVTLGTDRRRGLALAVAMSGSAIGVIYVPQIAALLIDTAGWRTAKAGLGLLVLVVALPAAYFFLKPPERPRVPAADAADPAVAEVPGLSLREAFRTRTFWMLMLAFLLSSAAIHGALGHLGAVITDRGLGIALAATCLSAMGVAQLIARFGSGYMLDRFSTPQVGQLWFLLALIGVSILAFADQAPLMIVGSMMLGFGLGAELELLAYFIGRYFGVKAFGQIYGFIFGAFILGISTGPYAMAHMFDREGDYRLGFIGMQACFVLASVALMFAGRYRFAARSHG